MGWFSGFCSWVGDKVKKAANYVKEKAVQAKNWIKDKYNQFTGKDMADKAKRIYEASRKKYDEASSNYKKEVDKYSNSIKKHIESINANKVLIKGTLFVELVRLLELVKEVEISQTFTKEAMNYTAYKPSGLRSQSQIMKIDFDNEPIKNNLKAIFTLATYHLIHGNILMSLRNNVLMLPTFVCAAVLFFKEEWTHKVAVSRTVCITVILYMILRNLPYYPFTLLAPVF